MTDAQIATLIERHRKAVAAVSRLEEMIMRAPQDRSLQLNLAAMRKIAMQSQEQLRKLSDIAPTGSTLR